MHIPKTKTHFTCSSCFPHWSIRKKVIIPQYIVILIRHYHNRDPLFIDQNKEISKVTTWTTCRIWTRWPNRGRVDLGFWLFMNFHCSHSTSRHICEEMNVWTSVMSHRGTLSTRYKKEIKSKELFFLCFLLMVVFFLCVLFGLRGGSDPFLRWQRVSPSHFWEISGSQHVGVWRSAT